LTEKKLEFTRRFDVLGNLGLFVWMLLAFFSVLFYNLIYGWLFLIFEAVLVYGVVRRFGCRSCDKCKECTMGFGRLAGIFFGRGFVKKASVGKSAGIVAFVYFLLLPLPVALLVLSMVQVFSVLKVIVLVCLLAIGGYSLSTWSTRSTINNQI